MPDVLRFRRLEHSVLKTDDAGVRRLDIAQLARELAGLDRDVKERLRRAALRAIEEELERILAEREESS